MVCENTVRVGGSIHRCHTDYFIPAGSIMIFNEW